MGKATKTSANCCVTITYQKTFSVELCWIMPQVLARSGLSKIWAYQKSNVDQSFFIRSGAISHATILKCEQSEQSPWDISYPGKIEQIFFVGNAPHRLTEQAAASDAKEVRPACVQCWRERIRGRNSFYDHKELDRPETPFGL